MCTPLLIGLALAVGGTAASAVGKQKADEAQSRVLANAQKAQASTANANENLLKQEAQKNSPSATAATNDVAALQSQNAMEGAGNQAVSLFNGLHKDSGGDVAGRVQAMNAPRTRALSVLQGQAEGSRRLGMEADRTNANIDANNQAASRMLGLLPMQMNLAGQSGRGWSTVGQLASATGAGLAGGSVWQPAVAAGGAAVNSGLGRAGASDLGPQQNPYANPYAAPRRPYLGQLQPVAG